MNTKGAGVWSPQATPPPTKPGAAQAKQSPYRPVQVPLTDLSHPHPPGRSPTATHTPAFQMTLADQVHWGVLKQTQETGTVIPFYTGKCDSQPASSQARTQDEVWLQTQALN